MPYGHASMLLLGEGSEATEPYNKYDKIRLHSIRSLQFDQKVRPLSFRPEKFDLFTATPPVRPRLARWEYKRGTRENGDIYEARFMLSIIPTLMVLSFFFNSRILQPGILQTGPNQFVENQKQNHDNTGRFSMKKLPKRLETFFCQNVLFPYTAYARSPSPSRKPAPTTIASRSPFPLGLCSCSTLERWDYKRPQGAAGH